MTNRWTLPAAASLVAAIPVAAQPPQTQPTLQQQFDAASAALAAQDWEEALRQYQALETRLAAGNNARSLAIVRVRRANALMRLDRVPEAAEALRLGLPALSASDRTLNEDRFNGYVALGRIAELDLDYRTAAAHYRTAESIDVGPSFRLGLFRGLIQTQMFFDAPAALAGADEALRAAAAGAPGDRTLEGQFRTMRGRVLLNMGRLPEAREELERALRLLGGLTLRVSVPDLVARSDLAIAAAVAGDHPAARRYLAYTGAGTTERASLPVSGRMTPPRCGNGLMPEDVGVVELSLRENGMIGHISPIYSSRQGEAALLFARAVRDWSFPAEDVREMPAVFRSSFRVELRCTHLLLEAGEAEPWEIAEAERWSTANGIALEFEPTRGRPAVQLRADLAAAEARHGARAPQLLVPLMRLAESNELRLAERVEILRRALPIAAAARVPSSYLGRIAVRIVHDNHQARERSWGSMPAYRAMLADPAVAGDPGAAATVQLALAHWLYTQRRWADAAALLARLRSSPELGANHPLMPAILDVLAAVEAARGNQPAADASWAAIPAGARRCTVAATRRPLGVSSGDFPRNAIEWGFEGNVTVETVVGRAGGAGSPRTVIAYPPFVFDRGAEELAARIRYVPVMEPSSGPCVVARHRFRFEIAR